MTRFNFVKQYLGAGMILDIGCVGKEGVWHQNIRKQASGRVWGVDVDINGLKKMGFPQLACADAQYLPFGDSKFDCIIMGEVLEHLWDPMSALLEARRVLKENGTLVVTTPNAYSLNRMISYTIHKRITLGQPDHKTLFTPEALFKLMRKCGFEPFRFETCKFQIPYTNRAIDFSVCLLNHLGANICIAARKAQIS